MEFITTFPWHNSNKFLSKQQPIEACVKHKDRIKLVLSPENSLSDLVNAVMSDNLWQNVSKYMAELDIFSKNLKCFESDIREVIFKLDEEIPLQILSTNCP